MITPEEHGYRILKSGLKRILLSLEMPIADGSTNESMVNMLRAVAALGPMKELDRPLRRDFELFYSVLAQVLSDIKCVDKPSVNADPVDKAESVISLLCKLFIKEVKIKLPILPQESVILLDPLEVFGLDFNEQLDKHKIELEGTLVILIGRGEVIERGMRVRRLSASRLDVRELSTSDLLEYAAKR